MTSGEPLPPIVRTPWHGRLSVRLGVLVGAGLTALFLTQPSLESLGYRFTSLPDPRLEDRYSIYTNLMLGVIAGGQLEQGQWTMAPSLAPSYRRFLEENGMGFLWVDEQGLVVDCFPAAAHPAGVPWSHPLSARLPYEYPIQVDGEAHSWRAFPIPVANDEEEEIGHVVALLPGSENRTTAEFRGDLHTAVNNALQYYAWRTEDLWDPPLHDHLLNHATKAGIRMRRILAISIPVVFMVLLGVMISVVFTRRLSSLIQEASQPLAIGSDLPGPFRDAGRDELAQLGRALNGMRDRMGVLLEDLADQENERRNWIAQVSHDIRTPLAALIVCLERAARSAEPEQVDQRTRELLQAALFDAERVRLLTDDLLEVARLDAGESMRFEELLPEEMIHELVRGMAPLAESQGKKLIHRIEGVTPSVKADGRLLFRALENLVRNALRHAEQTVEVGLVVHGGSLCFRVADDGPGFPVAPGTLDLARLKQLGQLSDSSGLGLRLTNRVVQAHDSNLVLGTSAAGGAQVTFELPAAGP